MDFLPLSGWVPPAHRDTSCLHELKGHFNDCSSEKSSSCCQEEVEVAPHWPWGDLTSCSPLPCTLTYLHTSRPTSYTGVCTYVHPVMCLHR